MGKVIILRGVSGTGKSTYCEAYINEAVVVSADHYFINAKGEYKFDPNHLGDAHGLCLRTYVDHLQHGDETIIVDNTNTSISEIAPYAALALAYGYELEIVTLLVDVEVAAARNVHNVPLETVRQQRRNLDNGTRQMPRWWPHKIVEVKNE